MEEDKISNARINYQMLQTLYDVKENEIKDLCKQSNKNITEISNSLENMLKFFGVRQEEEGSSNKDSFLNQPDLYQQVKY